MWCVLAAAALGHSPGYGDSSTHTIQDTELSQVEYRRAGTHTFSWQCSHTSQPVYWEVTTAEVASLHVHVSDAAMLQNMSIPEPHSHPSDNAFNVFGCPLRRHREVFTALPVLTLAQFGEAPCSPADAVQSITVSSSKPIGFVIGKKESWSTLWGMPYFYIKTGAVMVGMRCPFTWIMIVWIVLWAVFVLYKVPWRTRVHALIASGWIVFIWYDLYRAMLVLEDPTGATCDADHYDHSVGSEHSGGTGTATVWAVHIMVRIVLYDILGGLAVLWYHHLQGSRWIVLLVSSLVMLTAPLLGIGGGLYGVFVFVYYVVDTLATTDAPVSGSFTW